MSNENPADKESIGNDRDAQTETENDATGLDSIETTEVDGEAMVPLSQVKELVHNELTEFIDIQSDDDNPAVEDIWIAGQPFGKIINSNRETAKSAEKQARAARSSDSEPTGNDAENGSGDDLLPIERLLRGEDDDWYVNSATESVERAKELYRHFQEWSSNTQKGRVIKTGGGKRGTATLQTLLNTVLDEPEISWKQVYRACQKLEEWTKGAIQYIDHRRHGKMLVMDGRASSAGSG
jgi:hypothetical protein